MNSEIIELPVSSEIERLVAPIVRAHVSHGLNTIWISTFAPDTDAHIWTWKAVAISREKAQQLLRVLSDGKSENKSKKK